MNENQSKQGIIAGFFCYLIWGVLPIYWKQLNNVGAFEVLANRFIWSVVFVGLIIVCTGRWQSFKEETALIFSKASMGIRMTLAAIMVSLNWGIFIWAVADGRIVETSMGYYINPLVNVLFGMMFLGERLLNLQKLAVFCATCGIGYLVYQTGSLPWVSIGLPLTFAYYGLLKKVIPGSAFTTTMIETVMISPIALGYLYYLSQRGGNAYQTGDARTLCFIVGAGIVTATPIILFTTAAKLLPFKTVGFLQYLAPSISFLIGVFMYGEPFTTTHAISFGCIWTGLFFYIWSQLKTH
ncbi:MAG: EamA family transporter RarD [Phascolarctobacterium sp.]|nr:EamA family transporter RarD [Phascolarctobacterium sp.]